MCWPCSWSALLVLSVVTRLDRVVSSTSGTIVTTRPTAVVQALDASIIKSINVRDGERVKAGDELATLDPTFATADVEALKLQIASLDARGRALRGRAGQSPLRAETDRKSGRRPGTPSCRRPFISSARRSSRGRSAPTTSRSRNILRPSPNFRTAKGATMTAPSWPGTSSRCARPWPQPRSAAAWLCWPPPIRRPRSCGTSSTTTTVCSRRAIR